MWANEIFLGDNFNIVYIFLKMSGLWLGKERVENIFMAIFA